MAEQVEEPVDNNSNDKVNNGSTESNRNENNNNNNDEENKDKKKNVDPELFSCLLQPVTSDSDPDYIGIRRLLLYRKAESGVRRRLVSFLSTLLVVLKLIIIIINSFVFFYYYYAHHIILFRKCVIGRSTGLDCKMLLDGAQFRRELVADQAGRNVFLFKENG